MATKIWAPNSVPLPHVVDVTPANILQGDVVRLSINNKFVEYKSKDGTAGELSTGLVAAWQQSTFGEMRRITATTINAVDGDSSTPVVGMRLSSTNGPFTVTATARNLGSSATISVTET